MDRQERIEQVSEANTVRLRNQPEKVGIAIEAPRLAGFHYFEVALAVTIYQFIGQLPFAVFVGQFDGDRTNPRHIDHGYEPIWQNAFDSRTAF
jgi:hypothetical protein